MRDLLIFVSLATVPAFAFAGYFFWRAIILTTFPLQNQWFEGLCALAGVWTAVVVAAIIRRQISE
ncbi:hypothetical protein [Mesorhizobium sp. WSM2239]|uniref:Uncharacterized protein n=2 Tax=unclassified Mesorhizobium TaxID=325217 RepID=A0AAU8D3H5_9HYPH